MNTDLIESNTAVISAQPPVGKIVMKGNELEVTASSAPEMANAQSALIEWCKGKIHSLKFDATELRESYRMAVERKWKSATLKRHAELAEKRVSYYEKVKTALESGFVIVPNFPVSIFAVRTDKENPKLATHWGRWRNADSQYEERAPGLPAGEGEYKNPDPLVKSFDSKDGSDKPIKFWADSFQDVDFPITMAKPHIMEATTRAMALKVFDDFGILPAAHRYQDPLIVARLRDPRQTGYMPTKYISFIIAWHLNTEMI